MRTLRVAQWMISECRSCSAPVVWASHIVTGKSQPINAEPDPGGMGNVRLVREDDDVHPRYLVLTATELDAANIAQRVSLRKSHFATCPDAPEWRNR